MGTLRQSLAGTFRANLRRLAKAQEMGCEELANALEFKGEDKKWLGRLWEQGLKRADRRKQKQLNRLARLLGVEVGDFWRPDVSINPALLARGDPSRWNRLVKIVADHVSLLNKLRARFPSEVLDILRRHGHDEISMLAEWVASEYLSCKLPQEETALVRRMMKEWSGAIQYDREKTLYMKVYERVNRHPAWHAMLSDLHRRHGLPYLGEIADEVKGDVWHCFHEAVNREPTAEEVYHRFAARYLDPYSEHSPSLECTEPDAGLEQVLNELHFHTEWMTHIERRFGGDERAAQRYVQQMWQKAKRDSDGVITPETFIGFYRSQHLDDLKPDDIEDEWLNPDA